MSDYFDKDGNPIDLETYARLHEEMSYKVMRRTRLGKAMVSSVWLGINHRFADGPPLIFETMVFEDWDGPMQDADMERYSTVEQAIAGHNAMVRKWAKRLGETPHDEPLDS